ncbi:MAG: endonuclease/exonuclease/phosphatase family protein [Phycisphaerales bacterium JB037]
MQRILRALIACVVLGLVTVGVRAGGSGLIQPGASPSDSGGAESVLAIRVMTFNLEDVRTADLLDPEHPRLRALAETIQRIRPNILFLNEIAYDLPGGPGVPADAEAGQNAKRFVENFLSRSQAPGLEPMEFAAFMAPSNTGMPSGFDLDNDGEIVTRYPAPEPNEAGGRPGAQTDAGRAYGNDCWGFGTFPGQYAMALLVDPRLEIVEDGVRTFQLLPWSYMPGAVLPKSADEEGGGWYSEEELGFMRLSSKSHWDVPVRLPNGAVVHVLGSHPTPPAFDGAEQRNKRRNHDEIRFWADYLEGASYVVDDAGGRGTLRRGALFVIVGDLNADSREGTGFGNPMRDLLLGQRRVGAFEAPVADLDLPDLEPTDTALWGKQVDYVIPSREIRVLRSGIWRHEGVGPGARRMKAESASGFASDHFPVWADLSVPGASGGPGGD